MPAGNGLLLMLIVTDISFCSVFLCKAALFTTSCTCTLQSPSSASPNSLHAHMHLMPFAICAGHCMPCIQGNGGYLNKSCLLMGTLTGAAPLWAAPISAGASIPIAASAVELKPCSSGAVSGAVSGAASAANALVHQLYPSHTHLQLCLASPLLAGCSVLMKRYLCQHLDRHLGNLSFLYFPYCPARQSGSPPLPQQLCCFQEWH